MMKLMDWKTIYSRMMIMVVLAMAACTTNNGDIGPWFGMWKVTEIKCDGVNEDQYAGNMFFKFQSTVFEEVVVSEHHAVGEEIGQWRSDQPGRLVVWFPDERYAPDAQSHMSREENVFTYDAVRASGFTLTLKAKDGHTYQYMLVKW